MVAQHLDGNAALVREKLILARSKRAESALKPFKPFFTGLAEQLAETYQLFSSAPAKCTVSQTLPETVSSEQFQLDGKRYSSERGDLRVLVRTDSQFHSFACETCFGGSGSIMRAEDDGNRPNSKVERRLHSAIINGFLVHIPKAVLAMTELTLGPPEPLAAIKGNVQPKDETVIAVTLLLNAFSLSTEVTCIFPQTELERLLAVRVTGEAPSMKTAEQVMMNCPFKLEALLPPERFYLNQIMALQSGSVLELQATTQAELQLRLQGTDVARARFEVRNNQISLSVT